MSNKRKNIRERLKEKLNPTQSQLIEIPKPKKMLFDKNDDPAIIALLNEINKNNSIMQDSTLFILHKNLKIVDMGTVLKKSDFPKELYSGVVYLIKGNTIIGFDTNFSYENKFHWLNDWEKLYKIPPDNNAILIRTDVRVYNLEMRDIEMFNSPQTFINMDGMQSYDLEKTENFIFALAQSGFDIYIKKIY